MSPTVSPGWADAVFLSAALGTPGRAPVVVAAIFDASDAFAEPLAMLLAGLEGIGGATRVQVSPPQRKPSTQPLISRCSGSVGLIEEE